MFVAAVAVVVLVLADERLRSPDDAMGEVDWLAWLASLAAWATRAAVVGWAPTRSFSLLLVTTVILAAASQANCAWSFGGREIGSLVGQTDQTGWLADVMGANVVVVVVVVAAEFSGLFARPVSVGAGAGAAEPRKHWRMRVSRWRSLVAVALAFALACWRRRRGRCCCLVWPHFVALVSRWPALSC